MGCDASMRELSRRFSRVATTSHGATTRPVNGFALVRSEHTPAAHIVSGIHRYPGSTPLMTRPQ